MLCTGMFDYNIECDKKIRSIECLSIRDWLNILQHVVRCYMAIRKMLLIWIY